MYYIKYYYLLLYSLVTEQEGWLVNSHYGDDLIDNIIKIFDALEVRSHCELPGIDQKNSIKFIRKKLLPK